MAIVIDDLGWRLPEGRQTLTLPPAVTLSVLPHTPHGARLATDAAARGHEIMLHLPMEARSGKRLGPGGLTEDMARDELRATVFDALASLPAVAGVSNHMGSLLTTRAAPMQWLMEALREQPALYFVDSRTAGSTVAGTTARAFGIPSYTRDVFLDDDPDPAVIRHQLARLLRVARTQGLALGIGHPYPSTLEVLAEWLPALAAHGVRLIPVSQLIARQRQLAEARLAAAEGEPTEVATPTPKPTGIPCC